MKRLSAQIALALDFLHGLGITHCDVKTENICVVSYEQRLFKMIDLGSAVTKLDSHNSYVQSRWYRAPEVMLGLDWGPKIDVWSLGCTLAEVVLGYPLFRAHSVEGVLASQVAALGPVPRSMRAAAASLARMFFTPAAEKGEQRIFSVDPRGMPAGVYTLTPAADTSLEALLEGHDEMFVVFVRCLLTIDPKERLSVQEALMHPWGAEEVRAYQKYQERLASDGRAAAAPFTASALAASSAAAASSSAAAASSMARSTQRRPPSSQSSTSSSPSPSSKRLVAPEPPEPPGPASAPPGSDKSRSLPASFNFKRPPLGRVESLHAPSGSTSDGLRPEPPPAASAWSETADKR